MHDDGQLTVRSSAQAIADTLRISRNSNRQDRTTGFKANPEKDGKGLRIFLGAAEIAGSLGVMTEAFLLPEISPVRMRIDPSASVSPARYFRRDSRSIVLRCLLNTSSLSPASPLK